MGLFKDIEKSLKRLTEGVDDVSDKEAKSKFKDLKDKDILTMLRYYELIDELNKVKGK